MKVPSYQLRYIPCERCRGTGDAASADDSMAPANHREGVRTACKHCSGAGRVHREVPTTIDAPLPGEQLGLL